MCGESFDWDLLAQAGDAFTNMARAAEEATVAMREWVDAWTLPPPDPMSPGPGKHRWEAWPRFEP